MKIAISLTYMAHCGADVTLPERHTWDDVESWFIKWDTLHIEWKDGTRWSHELNCDCLDGLDVKYPSAVTICDEHQNLLEDD